MATTKETLCDLLKDTVCAFARHAGFVVTSATETESIIIISLRVHNDDHRRVIGQRGQMIKALQAVFSAAGTLCGRSVMLSLTEPVEGDRLPDEPFQPREDIDHLPIINLASRLLKISCPFNFTIKCVSEGAISAIQVWPDGSWQNIARVGNALNTIFASIGRGNGRVMTLDLIDIETCESVRADQSKI